MGTTANYSWPYPESSDFVADGATAIENLADAADTTVHGLATTVAGLNTGNVQYVGTNSGNAGGYPATCSSSGAWMINPTVAVTTSGESLLVTFVATWVNTTSNLLELYAYDSGTANTYTMLDGRFAAGNNNAAGHVIFTPSAGARSIGLHFASSGGTMEAYGSENFARLTVHRIRP